MPVCIFTLRQLSLLNIILANWHYNKLYSFSFLFPFHSLLYEQAKFCIEIPFRITCEKHTSASCKSHAAIILQLIYLSLCVLIYFKIFWTYSANEYMAGLCNSSCHFPSVLNSKRRWWIYIYIFLSHTPFGVLSKQMLCVYHFPHPHNISLSLI